MKKTLSLLFSVGLLFGVSTLSGCNRPSEAECQQAHENIKRIYGTDQGSFGLEVNKTKRSCRGTAKRERVLCTGSAQTVEDLEKCLKK